jgi:hypothetical protein
MEQNTSFLYTTKDEIKSFLNARGIKNYTIHDDLVVDVDEHIRINDKELTQFPFQFGVVKGDFWASFIPLCSLKGSPREVQGNFDVSYTQITSLEYCPEIITQDFNAVRNNIQNLNFTPKKVDVLSLGFNKMKLEHFVNVQLNEFKHIASNENEKIELLKPFYKPYQSYGKYNEVSLNKEEFKTIMDMLKEKNLLEAATLANNHEAKKLKI